MNPFWEDETPIHNTSIKRPALTPVLMWLDQDKGGQRGVELTRSSWVKWGLLTGRRRIHGSRPHTQTLPLLIPPAKYPTSGYICKLGGLGRGPFWVLWDGWQG